MLTPFLLPFAAALLVYNLTAAPSVSWQHGGDDGGDLALALAYLGIPHPSGYPLYLLAGRFFLWFTSDPARALNLASAFWGGLAAGLTGLNTFYLSRTFFEKEHRHISETQFLAPVLGGIFAGLLTAFAPLFWSQALIAEVYTFNLGLLALQMLALTGWWRTQSKGRGLLLALLTGLAVGHHRTGLFMLVAMLVFVFVSLRQVNSPQRIRFSWQSLSLMTGLFLLGSIGPTFYLLVRGGAVPASNWSDPGFNNLAGFWEEISGSEYRALLFAAPLSQSLGRVSASAGLLLQQFGITGVLFGWVGLLVAWNRRAARPFFWMIVSGIILYVGFAAVYAADNSQVYLLPAFTLWAMLAGWGLAYTLQELPKRFGQKIALSLGTGLILLALLVPGLSLFNNYSRLDLSRDHSTENWLQAELETAPANAILLSYGDATTFALWYGHYWEKRRPDLIIIEGRLMTTEWYRRNLAHLYPELKLPDSSNNLTQTLLVLNPGRPLQVVSEPVTLKKGLP